MNSAYGATTVARIGSRLGSIEGINGGATVTPLSTLDDFSITNTAVDGMRSVQVATPVSSGGETLNSSQSAISQNGHHRSI
jgi:hypothetical protein